MTSKRKTQAAFTLLEILVVLGAIAIIVLMIAPALRNVVTTGQANRTTADLALANRLLDSFQESGGSFSAGGGGSTVIDNTSATTVWNDLRGGTKAVRGITCTLPVSFATTPLPTGWTLTGANRFQ